MRRLFLVLATLVGLLQVCWALVIFMQIGSVYADTHYVALNNSTPAAPYTSWASASTNIQSAVDAATTNDTILVRNGTYLIAREILISKACSLQSTNGPEVTIIDGGSRTRCLSLSADGIVIDGFTVANGKSTEGAGLHVSGHASVTNSILSNNYAGAGGFGDGGGACYVTGSLILYGCELISNTAYQASGGAIKVLTTGSLSATNCTFLTNTSIPPYGGGWGGAIYQSPGSTDLSIVNCVFRYNTGSYGGAVFVRQGALVSNCLFDENASEYGGAIYSEQIPGVLNVSDSIFANNSASISGGAIRSWLSNLLVDNCMFFRNSCARNSGGAIEEDIGGCNYISHCEFIENSPVSVRGGVILSTGLTNTFADLDLDGADTYSEWVLDHNQVVAEEPFAIGIAAPLSIAIPSTSSHRHYSLDGIADLASTNWLSIYEFTGGESPTVVDVNPYPYSFYRVSVSIP